MKGIETYRENAVTTQTKGKLVVMLYDGAIKFLKMAIKKIEAKNPEEKGKYISKAIDIIFELNTVLDMEAGGEVAMNLRKLYMFMGKHYELIKVLKKADFVVHILSLKIQFTQQGF